MPGKICRFNSHGDASSHSVVQRPGQRSERTTTTLRPVGVKRSSKYGWICSDIAREPSILVSSTSSTTSMKNVGRYTPGAEVGRPFCHQFTGEREVAERDVHIILSDKDLFGDVFNNGALFFERQ